MAILRIPEEGERFDEPEAIRARLAPAGVSFERWEASRPLSEEASAEEVLAAYRGEIERLKEEGGYRTADVIDVTAETPGLDAMLEKFCREHWHDEDEVRFIVAGRGLFHLHPEGSPVLAVEVGPGDLLRVPRGMKHWFDLCADRRIRAIRLFQDPAGWTPHYTDSGVDAEHQPVCLGPHQVRGAAAV